MPHPQRTDSHKPNIVPFNPSSNILHQKKKIKKGTTQRRKLKTERGTRRVRFKLSDNAVNKYHCPELKPSWETKIESGKPMEGAFKIKKVPYISLKDLFN